MKKKPNGVQLRKIPNLIDNNFVVTDKDDGHFRVYSLSDHLYQVNYKRIPG